MRRNFTLGQEGNRYDVRLRTESTNDNGIPSLASPENSLRAELTHVVYTRDAAGIWQDTVIMFRWIRNGLHEPAAPIDLR